MPGRRHFCDESKVDARDIKGQMLANARAKDASVEDLNRQMTGGELQQDAYTHIDKHTSTRKITQFAKVDKESESRQADADRVRRHETS